MVIQIYIKEFKLFIILRKIKEIIYTILAPTIICPYKGQASQETCIRFSLYAKSVNH